MRRPTGSANAVRRLLAFAVDWFVVVLWGGVIFGAVMIATGGNPPRPENPWAGQAVSFLAMTVPFILYFAVCESSALRASLGKRVLGLVVCRETGGRLPFGSALFRNTVKFTPWEFGHTVAWQAILSGEAGFPAWVWGPAIIAFVGPAWWLVAMIATGRTPYDRWAFARVGIAQIPESRPEMAAERVAAT
ncbi:MAG TPA: RDD family protein [Gemmataceae bacterium]|nr:RDD family protein [Gemmataceae bacterium]